MCGGASTNTLTITIALTNTNSLLNGTISNALAYLGGIFSRDIIMMCSKNSSK